MWSAPGLFRAFEVIASRALAGKSVPFLPLLLYYAPFWWPWAIATPVVAWLLRRLPVQAAAGFLAHLLLSFAAASLHMTLLGVWNQGVAPEPPATFADSLQILFLSAWWVMSWITYWLILAIRQGIAFERRSLRHQLQAARLEARLAQAELQALQMQLDPRALRGALAGVRELVEKDRPDEAVRSISRLAGDLRRMLAAPNPAETPRN